MLRRLVVGSEVRSLLPRRLLGKRCELRRWPLSLGWAVDGSQARRRHPTLTIGTKGVVSLQSRLLFRWLHGRRRWRIYPAPELLLLLLLRR